MKDERPIRIVMAVTNDLATDRRVLRHARALREVGCEVRLIGRKKSNSMSVREEAEWIRTWFIRGALFYAEYNVRLLFKLLTMRADIVVANDVDTLCGSYVAAKLKRMRLVVDAHELFSEVPELEGRERVKRVWRWVERKLMPRCDGAMTVCESIAKYYKTHVGVEMMVVRNLDDRPPKAGRVGLRSGCAGERVLLYQGCVNVGRGVDWAIDALEWMDGCRLIVVGDGDLMAQMRRRAAAKPWAERIEFLGRVEPSRLDEIMEKADVGLVMLEDRGLSYHFALPNRVGDFVWAGLPMVVSDLPEMAKVVRQYEVGRVIEGIGAKSLAECCLRVLDEWDKMDEGEARKRFMAARADMDWARERKRLIETVCGK